jgi:arylsulfatase A-like enzyme
VTRSLAVFVVGSFLFLAPGVDASPQLAVARRFADDCTVCSTATHAARSATAVSLRAFRWRPRVDAQNAVLRFSFVAKGAATITIRQSDKVIAEKQIDGGVAWETDVPIATLSRDDVLSFESTRDARWLDPVILVPASDTRPNILLICVDTLRADRLGGANNAMPKTWNWMQRGARFMRTYANAPWTLPSITTILTGRTPGNHNAGRRTDLGPAKTEYDLRPAPGKQGYRLTLVGHKYEFHRLSPSIPTLAEMLGKAGYYTAALHQNGFLDFPIDALRGFDLAWHYPGKGESGTPKALAWLAKNRATRFAMFLHYIDVHQWPVEIPQELHGTAEAKLTAEQRAKLGSIYDKQCAITDDYIDRVLSELDQAGMLANTIVVITSDHGEAIAEYGRVEGHGAGVQENILRVPLGFFGPGIKPVSIDTRVSLRSIAPTLLDYARAPRPANLAQRSMRPMIERQAGHDRDFTSEFVLYGDDQAAMYSGHWKYVDGEGGAEYLYDLHSDPAAMTDIGKANAEVLDRLHRAFRKQQIEKLERLKAEKDEGITLTPETIDSLRSLGYLGGS